jgi:hypothetical protein
MIEKYAPYPIKRDEMNKCWMVKLKSREINCYSAERDAQLISSIPCLYEKLELNDNTSHHNYDFRNSLQQTVEIINNYRITGWMARKIQSCCKEISKKEQPW